MHDIELNRQFSNSRITSIEQDSKESMYFSTSRGLLKYDGERWSRIGTTSPVQKLFHHEGTERLFVGMKEGAAEVMQTDSGTFSTTAVPGIDPEEPIGMIIGTEEAVFFIGESKIFRLYAEEDMPAEEFAFPGALVTGAFVHEQQLYLLFFQEGLFKWHEDLLEGVDNYMSMAEDQVLFSFATSIGTMVGFDNDMVFFFDGKAMQPTAPQLQDFLKENLLSDGIALNDSMMAFSTLAGGAAVAGISDQRIRYQFDYSTGARDNEIFCLGRDNDHGLWFAYEQGLTRVDLLQPITSYSGYPGLDGNLTSSLMTEDGLYVGTGNGVFKLEQASDAAEIDRMLATIRRKREMVQENERSNYIPPENLRPEETEEDELLERFKESPKEVKQELSRKEVRELRRELRKQRRAEREKKTVGEAIRDLFSGGNDEEKSTEEPTDTVSDNSDTPEQRTTEVQPKPKAAPARQKAQLNDRLEEVKMMRNAYLFRKVKGIDVKCRQLLQIGKEVFAVTNNGLYSIQGNSAKNLTPGTYINHAVKRKDDSRMLMATLKGVLELSRNSLGQWAVHTLSDTTQFVAYNVTEDTNTNVWAGTDNGAYCYRDDDVHFYAVPEILNERVLASNVDGTVHLLLPHSLYRYDASEDTVLAASLPELPINQRLEYVLGNNDVIWARSSQAWHVVNGSDFRSALPYLDLFQDIRHLSSGADGNIYVIDQGKHVYAIEHRSGTKPHQFNVYFRSVSDEKGQGFSVQSMKMASNGSSLVFSVSAPFYLNNSGTQYQYRIKGLRNSWSRWSANSDIDPGNIPPGDYTFEVRARNVLGEVSEVKSLAFSIPKPLYLRWYFIMLYLLAVVAVIWGIIKYREKSLKETQRILEKKVEERTADLAREKERAEGLLLNILPKETADELQKSGKATARHYNHVSVMFTDFKGFTAMAENTSPQDLVNELHRHFVAFDSVIEKYYLEKIKTIGDAYMCAGGVPIRNSSNAIAITLAALEIRDYMEMVNAEKMKEGKNELGIRLGIHTGPLTAGVVGMKKFAYDIWGDTVNTASRMESSSDPGKINVSGTTCDMIKKYFVMEHRGKRQAKGKGLVDMYFVERIKPEYSENADGKTPNKELLELVS